MRLFIFGVVAVFNGIALVPSVSAATFNLDYHHKHFLFTISVAKQKNWTHPTEIWTYNGKVVIPPQELRVDGDVIPALPSGFSKEKKQMLDRREIIATLRDVIASALDREAGKVTIGMTGSGTVTFDGIGFSGQKTDIEAAADTTILALNSGVSDIFLTVAETPPQIIVTSEKLRNMGIKELVTVGESDFSNSPNNRRHNIAVGLAKFNGHIIPKDSIFSFDEVLGRVDGSTGYKKELVIKGDQTIPDYGGGLCQVSSTAYRGVWEYGFPITKRINHSYTVSHYLPQGTDATVYPPNIDMKFKNDSDGALLIQTYAANDRAYFLYYGTKDERHAELFGPFIWNRRAPPPDRRQPTLDLPVGHTKKLGERVPGMNAAWFRVLKNGSGETVQGTYSNYEARPLYLLFGVDAIPTGQTGASLPKVFLSD